MIIKKLIKIIKIFYYFKNPFSVIKFYGGNFEKGKKIIIKPWNGEDFVVARSGDSWILNKILKGKKIDIFHDLKKQQNYFIERDIFLRQGTSDTFIYKEVFINKCYSRNIKDLTQKSTVIDIGAHIGLFSIYCSHKCGKVFSYEAHKDNYDLAEKNIKNKNINNVSINNLAVWPSPGNVIELSDDEGGQTGEHKIEINDSKKTIKVNSISIEDIFKNNKIEYCDLLKMDIEGAEYASFFSIPDEIFKKIGNICMEYHPDIEDKNTVEDLVNLLREKGFSIEKKEINKEVGLIYAKKKI